MRERTFVLAALLVALTACGGEPDDDATPTKQPSPTSSAAEPSPPRSVLTPGPTLSPKRPERPDDPRWVYFTDDQRRYASPWYAGRHRILIPFGCTPAPYYDPDPTCPGGNGKHHGIDVAIPCGVPLRAGRPAEVIDNDSLGPAYGVNPVLLRVDDLDVVIGHTERVFVSPGDTIERGQRFALVGDSAAGDGCHLHFEVRPAGADYLQAVDPGPLLALR